MLRNSFIVFICGWIIWFWIEKPAAGFDLFLQTDDNILINFQRFFDLFKSGYLVQSYIYIWYAHYLVISLIVGIIMSLLYGFVSDYLSRRQTRKRFIQPSTIEKKDDIEKIIDQN